MRLASLVRLQHPATIDQYSDATLRHAEVILVRLLGGKTYWSYGVTALQRLVDRGKKTQLIFLSGDGQIDPELMRLSTIDKEIYQTLHQLFTAGGTSVCIAALEILNSLVTGIKQSEVVEIPPPLPAFGFWNWRGESQWSENKNRAKVGIIFYRALVLADDTAAVHALCLALDEAGFRAQPIFVPSLKDQASQEFIQFHFADDKPEFIITLTGFTAGIGFGQSDSPFFARFNCPIIQAIQSSSSLEFWLDGHRGLSPRDLAMSVVLPETDGRIGAMVISFKKIIERDSITQCELVKHSPHPPLITALVEQVAAWIRLRQTPVESRLIAIMLANYPVRDGRIGNGVGLAVPESLFAIVSQLSQIGYTVINPYDSAQSLMDRITAGATNRLSTNRIGGVFYPLQNYLAALRHLPAATVAAVRERWGEPECDPYLVTDSNGAGFVLAVTDLGGVQIVIQPPRGYDLDPQSSYHDPALIPPHYYLAVYLWLRYEWQAHAVVQLGKHGTVEWLPGKSVGLSPECWPRAILGSLPLLYPFIVNDPGEGTQAKRRGAAVIIDHLTPPLTRAGSYGVQRDLETLIDEYHSATSLDPRRADGLARDIFDLAESAGLLSDCGITLPDQEQTRDRQLNPIDLAKLDSFICDLKELQIRDGLHILTQSPQGEQLASLCQSLLRVPRGSGEGRDQSILRALAQDLKLPIEFDPPQR